MQRIVAASEDQIADNPALIREVHRAVSGSTHHIARRLDHTSRLIDDAVTATHVLEPDGRRSRGTDSPKIGDGIAAAFGVDRLAAALRTGGENLAAGIDRDGAIIAKLHRVAARVVQARCVNPSILYKRSARDSYRRVIGKTDPICVAHNDLCVRKEINRGARCRTRSRADRARPGIR